jgi:hypothetical protein
VNRKEFESIGSPWTSYLSFPLCPYCFCSQNTGFDKEWEGVKKCDECNRPFWLKAEKQIMHTTYKKWDNQDARLKERLASPQHGKGDSEAPSPVA